MRKQYFVWMFLVAAIVLTTYGGYSIIYNAAHNKSISILAIIFLSVGGVMLITFLVLFTISYFQVKKRKELEEPSKEVAEQIAEEIKVEEPKEEKPVNRPTYSSRNDYEYTPSRSRYDSDYSTVYVKRVGYGPVLRVEGSRILDMRSNTYYSIEGKILNENGRGPVYELSGDKVRIYSGRYLYELSGNNVNKVFGGFYASFSGNYLQTFDLKEKYEIDGSINKSQKLAVIALLFGEY